VKKKGGGNIIVSDVDSDRQRKPKGETTRPQGGNKSYAAKFFENERCRGKRNCNEARRSPKNVLG